MSLHRISVKYFVQNPEVVKSAAFIPVFQRWIQDHAVEGMLIDVVDYKHVHEGPGVILIGHEADYALDLDGGRPGLLYVRKRQLHDQLRDTLRQAFRLALTACAHIEVEEDLADIRFDTGEAVVTFLDRLRAPNEPETLQLVHDDLQAVLRDLYKEGTITLDVTHADPRYPFSVRVSASDAPNLATLISRLEANAPVSI